MHKLLAVFNVVGGGLLIVLGLFYVSTRVLFGLGGGFLGDVLAVLGPNVAHADYSAGGGGSTGGGSGSFGGCDGGACTPGWACGLSGSGGSGGGTGSGTGSCGGSC